MVAKIIIICDSDWEREKFGTCWTNEKNGIHKSKLNCATVSLKNYNVELESVRIRLKGGFRDLSENVWCLWLYFEYDIQ